MDPDIEKIIKDQEEKERTKSALLGTQGYTSAFLIAVLYIFFNPEQIVVFGEILSLGILQEIIGYIFSVAIMTIAFMVPIGICTAITENVLRKKTDKEQDKYLLTFVIIVMVIFFFIKDYFL